MKAKVTSTCQKSGRQGSPAQVGHEQQSQCGDSSLSCLSCPQFSLSLSSGSSVLCTLKSFSLKRMKYSPLRSPFILESLSVPGLAKVYWKVPAGPELLFRVHACSLGVN